VSHLKQKGDLFYDVTLEIMSKVGGIFAGIAPLASIIVGFLNGGSFATNIIQNLFLARKETPEVDSRKGESHNVVAAHSLS
jgi:hypothetical protein